MDGLYSHPFCCLAWSIPALEQTVPWKEVVPGEEIAASTEALANEVSPEMPLLVALSLLPPTPNGRPSDMSRLADSSAPIS